MKIPCSVKDCGGHIEANPSLWLTIDQEPQGVTLSVYGIDLDVVLACDWNEHSFDLDANLDVATDIARALSRLESALKGIEATT